MNANVWRVSNESRCPQRIAFTSSRDHAFGWFCAALTTPFAPNLSIASGTTPPGASEVSTSFPRTFFPA